MYFFRVILEELKKELKQEGHIRFRVKVIPKSSRTEFVGMLGDLLKIKIAAIADKNKANIELIKFLSKQFDVAQSNVRITSGATSSQKTISIKI